MGAMGYIFRLWVYGDYIVTGIPEFVSPNLVVKRLSYQSNSQVDYKIAQFRLFGTDLMLCA